jgi:hypothetical protein
MTLAISVLPPCRLGPGRNQAGDTVGFPGRPSRGASHVAFFAKNSHRHGLSGLQSSWWPRVDPYPRRRIGPPR